MENKKYTKINISKEYKKVIEYVIKIAKEIYKDNLNSLFLAGSTGKGEMIDGWSDLDIYIITNKLDLESNKKFYELSLKEEKIHIGTTFYTIDNINNLFVDAKTIISIYEYQNYNVNAFIYGKINFPKIEYSYLVNRTAKPLINEAIQAVIREYNNYLISEKNLKSLVKKLTVLLKIYLNLNYETFTFGYKNVFETYFEKTNTNYIDIKKIIKTNDMEKEMIKTTNEILNTIIVG